MARISELSDATLAEIESSAKSKAQACSHLDAAAQALTGVFYDALAGSVVLARVYATIPYGRLPASNREFVGNLARAKGVDSELREGTPVLTLLGTSGKRPEWNDRRQSKGHVGIPLVSTSFVEAIPMIARLLTELGIDLAWVDRQEQGITSEAATTGVGGVFYVEDAATTKDRMGRHVIPAQDFVAEEGVRSVVGAGVTYVDGTLAVLVLFTNERLTRAVAERILPVMKTFKLATTVTAVSKGQLMT